MTNRFRVDCVDTIRLEGLGEVEASDLMSPYVRRQNNGRLGILVRVVPAQGSGDTVSGRIWYGEGEDGLSFAMDEKPLLVPGPDVQDLHGCEDPTMVSLKSEIVVFYTGVDLDGTARLLWAAGPDIHSLKKKGIAIHPINGEHNVKEAEIAILNDCWTLGYEYTHDDTSMIGLAEGDGPSGPWRETKSNFLARPDHWGSWHLSPGPMLLDDIDYPIMFYNGATHDAVWGSGWVVFDRINTSVSERCGLPLIAPPGEEDNRNIAFAASLLEENERIHLHFSKNDRTLHRALISRCRIRASGDTACPTCRIPKYLICH